MLHQLGWFLFGLYGTLFVQIDISKTDIILCTPLLPHFACYAFCSFSTRLCYRSQVSNKVLTISMRKKYSEANLFLLTFLCCHGWFFLLCFPMLLSCLNLPLTVSWYAVSFLYLEPIVSLDSQFHFMLILSGFGCDIFHYLHAYYLGWEDVMCKGMQAFKNNGIVECVTIKYNFILSLSFLFNR